MNESLARQLTQRFYRYLAVSSQSNAASKVLPSTLNNIKWHNCWRMSCKTWV